MSCFLDARGTAVHIHDQAVRVGKQEDRIVFDAVYFQNDAHHSGLISGHAHAFQEAATIHRYRSVEQIGADLRILDVEIDAVGSSDARGLIFRLRANIDDHSRIRVGVPGANA